MNRLNIYFIWKEYFSYTVLIIILSIIISGCFDSRENEINEQIYATVNGTYLTESGLRAIVPKEFYERLTPEHKRKIVEEWVNKELLYQEALRIGIDKEPEIQRLLLNSKQNLLSNEFLERELSNIKIPGEDELKKYHEDNKEFFILDAVEYRIRYALFDNSKEATSFYRKVKNNESFSELAQEFSKHPSSNSGGDLGIVNEESVEPNIWEAINSVYSRSGLRKISDVFTVNDGWGCVIVDEVFEPESLKPFEYVRDLVIDMYMAEKREEAKISLIKKLYTKADIRFEILR